MKRCVSICLAAVMLAGVSAAAIKKGPVKRPAASAKEPTSLRDLEDRMKFREVGVLGPKASPYKIVGRNWNASSTYYFTRGKVLRGDRMDPKRLPAGTRVFLRK